MHDDSRFIPAFLLVSYFTIAFQASLFFNFNFFILAWFIVFILGFKEAKKLFKLTKYSEKVKNIIPKTVLLATCFAVFFIATKYDLETFMTKLSILAISVALGDWTALEIGKRFGLSKFAYTITFNKPLLAPNISPNKTKLGALAGFLSCGFLFYTSNTVILNNHNITTLFFGFLIGIIGILGDLIESDLKRKAGKKDSSTALKGHGGYLDRFDSHIAVITIASYFI